MSSNQTGIAVSCKGTILNWLTFILKTNVELDGQKHKAGSAATFLAAAAGRHELFFFWRPLPLGFKWGKARVTVNVTEGQTVQVTWKAPFFWFLPGKVTVEPQSAAA
jgi:hypothetical protein